MLREPTIDNLRLLHLNGMVAAFRHQLENPNIEALPFEERLALIVEAELEMRQNRALARLLRQSKLRFTHACIEDINYQKPRNLDKATITRLSAGGYILRHQNIIITGACGLGKSYLACALGQMACRTGITVSYHRVPRLLSDLLITHGDGSWLQMLASLRKTRLLILDDWGLQSLNPTESRDLLEIIEDRYQKGSTIITSQLPVEHWHSLFPDPTVAEALLDRLVHNAHRIELNGESMRKVQALGEEQAEDISDTPPLKAYIVNETSLSTPSETSQHRDPDLVSIKPTPSEYVSGEARINVRKNQET